MLTLLLLAAGSRAEATVSPIQHVVVLYQENHSFDNVLGDLCVVDSRCNGTTSGKVSNGQTIPLSAAADLVPEVAHDHPSQVAALDKGLMDHFDLLTGCGAPTYACYTQFAPSAIPNLAALARSFALSDATFQLDQTASWGSHLELVTGTQDGFVGNNPRSSPAAGVTPGPGWGCDSHRQDLWRSPSGTSSLVPSCIPFKNGTGAYMKTPVPWVPTLMDEMDKVGLTYSIDAGSAPVGTAAFQPSGYQWALCPTFADCLETHQKSHLHFASQIVADASAGSLPAVSIVTPTGDNSQHNADSMLAGDNWIGSVVNALEHSRQWSSTAIFIAYDDCGCFYDHVAPPAAGLGPRIPVVIVSPYAIARHTDSKVATQASFLAFIEHTFGLPALGSSDSSAYDYSGSFNYRQTPLTPVPLVAHPVPSRPANAPTPDPNDST